MNFDLQHFDKVLLALALLSLMYFLFLYVNTSPIAIQLMPSQVWRSWRKPLILSGLAFLAFCLRVWVNSRVP